MPLNIVYGSYKLTYLYEDIDECLQNSGICGLGTCTNNDDGTFYECECEDNAELTGSNMDGSLTCIGKKAHSHNMKAPPHFSFLSSHM